MKSAPFCTAILFIIFINVNSFAQGEAALPFLTYPVSSLSAGMGSVGTSVLVNDAYGFLYNPAQLGYISQFTNFSFQTFFEKPEIGKEYLKNFSLGTISGLALNLGYNFESILKFPLSLGFGFSNPEINYVLFPETTEYLEKDNYNAYSLGLGLNYFINFNLGITLKSINSEFTGYSGPDLQIKSVGGGSGVSAYDIGFLIGVPIWELFDQNFQKEILGNIPIVPSLNFFIGYTQSNIGDEVYYLDKVQADPLPREARLGYSVSAGIKLSKEIYDLEIFHLDFSVEAEDYLIVRDSTGHTRPYQKFLGDINIGRNIFGIKGDDKVYAHEGLKLSLLETAEFLWGHIGHQQNLLKTNGFVIRLKGFLRFITDERKDPVTNFIADHLDLRYYNSNYLIDTISETNFKSLELVFTNFKFD